MDTVIRRARREDVPAIVAMLADDPLGAQREQQGDPAYLAAFDDLDADPRQLLVVGELGGEVVGTMQLTFLPGLSRRGATRAQIARHGLKAGKTLPTSAETNGKPIQAVTKKKVIA